VSEEIKTNATSVKITTQQWKVLFATAAGYALDAMDTVLYSMVILQVMAEFSMDTSIGGLIASGSLAGAAAGGTIAGVIADKVGRRKALMLTVLVYSFFTFMCGLSQSVLQLMIFRILLGLGMGGEWTAGVALITETWPAKHRGKAMGFVISNWCVGWALAALVTMIVLPRFGWRMVFFVGILPALLILWIRKNIDESEVWLRQKGKDLNEGSGRSAISCLTALFSRKHIRITVIMCALASAILFGYWGIFTWVPGFLASPIANGGAGLDIVKSGSFILLLNVGGFIGFNSMGWITDMFGRKRPFLIYAFVAAILVPIYGQMRDPMILMFMGPVLAYFGMGVFPFFGTVLSEFYPTDIRATAIGFTYNFGRGVSAFAPFIIGTLALNMGLGSAFLAGSIAYAVGGFIVLLLPETKGLEFD